MSVFPPNLPVPAADRARACRAALIRRRRATAPAASPAEPTA
ncbi:hypothetical protein OG422_11900 [Streptomyces sp. NBC_01525]